MKNTSKIVVVGGTGKSGKYLVEQLLKNGYHFKVLVRNLEKFKIESPQIELVHGDVSDYETISILITECYAVISTLGTGVPYSPATIFSTASINIVRTMNEQGLKRYIVVTGLNVDTPTDKKSPKVKFSTDWMYQNFPKSTADRQLEFEFLSKSEIDWTLVRLPLIILTDQQKEVVVHLEDCLGEGISATDLANFLISQLTDTSFVQKAPFIANV